MLPADVFDRGIVHNTSHFGDGTLVYNETVRSRSSLLPTLFVQDGLQQQPALVPYRSPGAQP